jgi:hypothetical protein
LANINDDDGENNHHFQQQQQQQQQQQKKKKKKRSSSLLFPTDLCFRGLLALGAGGRHTVRKEKRGERKQESEKVRELKD